MSLSSGRQIESSKVPWTDEDTATSTRGGERVDSPVRAGRSNCAASRPTRQSGTVAALYVQSGGIYYTLQLQGWMVDCWDEQRDALLYDGPWPVVAHPPCKAWSLMSQCRPEIVPGQDGGCFESALAAVRKFGGVLEHPAYSKAWRAFQLARPAAEGWTQSFGDPGWTCQVDQAHYGHPANKQTWLYYVGPTPPPLLWWRGPNTGRTVRNDGGGGRDQRSITPRPFALELIGLARLSLVEAAA